MKKNNVFVVIAAYNEERSITRVIKGLKKHGYRNIVVVDDGSKDSTFEIISKSGATALQHFINRGQGASLKTGIDYALMKGADYIVTFDADGQHHPEDIERLLKPVMNGECEAALGSRFLKKDSNTPFLRRLVLKMGVLVVWILYGIKLTDSHNGFRVFSRTAAHRINITSDRMEHASQIVEEIHSRRIPYKEVPVTITYSDYSKQKGQRGWNSVKIGFRMLFRKLTH
ncbi:glycosyltransferase family 2 protein [Candidatus Woesearchaeota archaeon]|nr:glycosyltransferase family 2 protein [Candidatus Woesearchaeota archaeon]